MVLRWLRRAVVVSAPLLMLGDNCAGTVTLVTPPPSPPDTSFSHPNGRIHVAITSSPFAFVVKNQAGEVLLESATPHESADPADPIRAYAPLALTHNQDATVQVPMVGWSYYRGDDSPWQRATRVTSYATAADGTLTAHIATDDAAHPGITLTLAAEGEGLHLVAQVDPSQADDADHADNRISFGFKLTAADHFLGFGERFVQSDHLGQLLYTYVEDAGFGHGEQTPPGPSNPSPNGYSMAYIPIPWFLSPRGYGMLLNTSFRSLYHLGDQASDAWRVESWDGPSSGTSKAVFDATIFVDKDPLNLVADLTAITGRPPAIADYVLAPRRRVNPGTDESQKLRAAHIPTSVADLDTHYFPSGDGSDHAAMKAMNADFHARGFKTVAYFCPFVSKDWHAAFDDAVAKGFLVKRADGTPYVVLDLPYNAGMVDFTNPGAVAWYQGYLQGALDDGWDGWMYDFAEYLPLDAVMFNGMRGDEAHNIYPLLYQKAAFDLLEKERKKDYLIFVRSGYAGPVPKQYAASGFLGTGGLVPMVWGGDNSTDFDLAKGLPATLNAALSAGMSGVPLWGSDIAGYHFIFNPPPDKEVYLRWTEVGAFSADMHDENAGNGTGVRWQIWNDQESQDVYRKYATWKTRMIPYTMLAVKEAQARGTPVMRHLYLHYPSDPKVYAIGDEFMLGDSLLVAPVVQRGLVSRPVYLPEAQYFDFWTGARVQGGDIVAQAPLGSVPVYAKLGAIVPLLAADIETVSPSTDGSVVSTADRADFLEAAIFAGGTTSVTLDDGTVIAQTAPTTPFAPASPTHGGVAIPQAATSAALMTCDACWFDDAASNVWSVAVKTQADTIVAGPVTVSVAGAPGVKRFLFTIRH